MLPGACIHGLYCWQGMQLCCPCSLPMSFLSCAAFPSPHTLFLRSCCSRAHPPVRAGPDAAVVSPGRGCYGRDAESSGVGDHCCCLHAAGTSVPGTGVCEWLGGGWVGEQGRGGATHLLDGQRSKHTLTALLVGPWGCVCVCVCSTCKQTWKGDNGPIAAACARLPAHSLCQGPPPARVCDIPHATHVSHPTPLHPLHTAARQVYKLAGCQWTASLFQSLGPQFAGGLLRQVGVPFCSQLFMGLGQPYLVDMLQATGELAGGASGRCVRKVCRA